MKGYPSEFRSLKLPNKQMSQERFPTIVSGGGGRYSLDTANRSFFKVTPVNVPVDSYDPLSGLLEISGVSVRSGDLARLIGGSLDRVETEILEVDSQGRLQLDPRVIKNGTFTEVQILRAISQTVDPEGTFTVSTGPIQFIRDGSPHQVIEDTIDPSNNVYLPVRDLEAAEVLSEISTKVDDLATEATLASLSTKVDDLATEATLASLSTKVDDLATEATLESVDTKLDSLATEATLASLDTKVDDLATEATLASLSTKVDDLATEATLESVDTKLDSLATEATLASLDTKVDDLATEATLGAILAALNTPPKEKIVASTYEASVQVETGVSSDVGPNTPEVPIHKIQIIYNDGMAVAVRFGGVLLGIVTQAGNTIPVDILGDGTKLSIEPFGVPSEVPLEGLVINLIGR